jgi:purine-binding chemotaxis protein CheW
MFFSGGHRHQKTGETTKQQQVLISSDLSPFPPPMSDTAPLPSRSERTTDKSTTATAPQFVGFSLADQNYIFRIERIQEIVIPTTISRVPEVPPYVDGVSNLRGTIIPIINLRALFGLSRKENDAETRTIVVNVGSRTIGCTVDSVSRVMRVPAEQMQPAPDSITSSGRKFIESFARVGEALYILLNVDELLDPANLEEVHKASSKFSDATAALSANI